MRRAVGVAIFGWALAGCAAQVRAMSGGGDGRDTTSVTTAKDARDFGCESEGLGLVEAAYAFDAPDDALRALREAAQKLGADAIVDVRRALAGGEERLLAQAVRCRAMREARPYEVLEAIDVPDFEATGDAAFAELRARAFELHADLVVDVRLRTDAAQHTHLTGVAIKYE